MVKFKQFVRKVCWAPPGGGSLFAAELRQQLLRRQQAGAAVAELDRQGIGEQEAEQRGVADGAHLNGVRRLLLKVFDRPGAMLSEAQISALVCESITSAACWKPLW